MYFADSFMDLIPYIAAHFHLHLIKARQIFNNIIIRAICRVN